MDRIPAKVYKKMKNKEDEVAESDRGGRNGIKDKKSIRWIVYVTCSRKKRMNSNTGTIPSGGG